MLRSYYIIALRNLQRHKGYALVNVFGLAIGMAACLLISLYIRHELSYDNFHEKGARIYRVDEAHGRLSEGASAFVQTETAPRLMATIPEVQEAVRLSPMRSGIRNDGKAFTDVQGMYAGGELFRVFDFGLLSGDAKALQRPNTAILTLPMAEKLFGNEDALGQTVSVEVRGRPTTLEVAGITQRVPPNSHFAFDFLISMETLRSVIGYEHFRAHEVWTYVLLREGATPAVTEANLQKVAGNIPSPPGYRLHLRPLSDLYLYYWTPREGDPRYLYLFSVVAAVILLIAGTNYTGMAMARATQRAREIGIRKALGAEQSQLAGQFLGESLLLSLLSLPLALGLVYLALPPFNTAAGTEITFALAGSASTLLLLVGLGVFVGLAAGGYPAVFLSRFRPANVLRGRLPLGWTGARLRKGLAVLQFALAAILLFSTAVIVHQLRYIQHKNLGFDAERVVVLSLQNNTLIEQAEVLKQELLRLPHIRKVALASGLPGGMGFSSSEFSWSGKTVNLTHLVADSDLIATLDLELVAGRGLSAARLADSSALVLNKEATRALGWASPEAAVDQSFSFFGHTWRVVGVVEDFHYESLHREIAPLALQFGPQKDAVAVRIEGGHVASALGRVRETWGRFTEMPFAYRFLDDQINQLYRQEQQTARVMGGFAGLALLLACMGLLALAAYTVERRTKEISIRKTMGASAASIVALLSKDVFKLLCFAFLIAIPVAYLAMRQWLAGFAYRIGLGPAPFLLIGVLVLSVALLTVSFHALRAALANPVENLRSE